MDRQSICVMALLLVSSCSSGGKPIVVDTGVDSIEPQDMPVGQDLPVAQDVPEAKDAEESGPQEVDTSPGCEGRECGPAPGGGTAGCGECRRTHICTEAGKCECPSDSVCGDDCCLQGSVCIGGKCCTPACGGMECGDDGCGRLCGTCATGQSCLASGLCGDPTCGGENCPQFPVPGWSVTCNGFGHCEYSNPLGLPEDAEIFVPSGTFVMGSPDTKVCESYLGANCWAELPAHAVTFAQGFFIDKYEVSNRQFARCVEAGVCTAPTKCSMGSPAWSGASGPDIGKEQWPVFCLMWQQARTYCQWVGKDLPSEAQWERAAKGAAERLYPWGNQAPDCELALTEECGKTKPDNVDSHPLGASPIGALNMAGNMEEWIADCYHSTYDGAPSDGSVWATDCVQEQFVDQFVMRGGSYVSPMGWGRVAARLGGLPPFVSVGGAANGLRCARFASQP